MAPIQDLVVVGIVVIALSGLRVAQEYERGVIFRLGRTRIVSPPTAVNQLALTGLRNNIGQHDLDEILAHSSNDHLQRQASSRSATDHNS
jgi:regulator of protease activity HflC (stomatin/prohibitin superfamily)